jgi:hypothetical protein
LGLHVLHLGGLPAPPPAHNPSWLVYGNLQASLVVPVMPSQFSSPHAYGLTGGSATFATGIKEPFSQYQSLQSPTASSFSWVVLLVGSATQVWLSMLHTGLWQIGTAKPWQSSSMLHPSVPVLLDAPPPPPLPPDMPPPEELDVSPPAP